MCEGFYGRTDPYRRVFARANADRIAYFRYWTHNTPMVVSFERERELHRIQRCLAKCARHYDHCYEDFLDVVPFDDRVLEVLSWTAGKHHDLGTFRADYVTGTDGTIQVCEITSRFFGNGYFYSFFFDNTGRELAFNEGIDDLHSGIEGMLHHFASMAKGKERVLVLSSADRSDAIPLYVPFYRELGLEVEVLQAEEAATFTTDDGTLVLSALNQRDLLSLPDDAIHRFIDADGRNDLRTVLLMHDKRMLALIFDDRFCEGCLSKEETAFIRRHVVRTHVRGHDPEVWRTARLDKDAYVLKHARLGKSERVYAGRLCTRSEWEALFEDEGIEDMILQPFVDQRLYPDIWKGELKDFYICGTLLCLDDEFFGTGNYRASTCPIINVADDSKVAPLVTDQIDRIPWAFVL